MKRIAFQSGQVSERGTEVALLDYALANERILGNTSVCLFPKDRILSETANRRFNSLFEVKYYESPAEWDSILQQQKIDGFYSIRFGGGSGKEELPSQVPAFIHCVFDTRRPYGTVCASISSYLNKKYHTKLAVMPHIVEKKSGAIDNLRKDLDISEGAAVFGCYGGKDNFSVGCARRAVLAAAKARPDIAFLFMNIEPFCEGRNIHFLPGSTDADVKQKFINTCDAMLHARRDGETFGLSVAEFFISGKPIITYQPIIDPRRRYDKAHLDILGEACSLYSTTRGLLDTLQNFKKAENDRTSIEATYLEPFSKERIMGIFDDLFVSKL